MYIIASSYDNEEEEASAAPLYNYIYFNLIPWKR